MCQSETTSFSGDAAMVITERPTPDSKPSPSSSTQKPDLEVTTDILDAIEKQLNETEFLIKKVEIMNNEKFSDIKMSSNESSSTLKEESGTTFSSSASTMMSSVTSPMTSQATTKAMETDKEEKDDMNTTVKETETKKSEMRDSDSQNNNQKEELKIKKDGPQPSRSVQEPEEESKKNDASSREKRQAGIRDFFNERFKREIEKVNSKESTDSEKSSTAMMTTGQEPSIETSSLVESKFTGIFSTTSSSPTRDTTPSTLSETKKDIQKLERRLSSLHERAKLRNKTSDFQLSLARAHKVKNTTKNFREGQEKLEEIAERVEDALRKIKELQNESPSNIDDVDDEFKPLRVIDQDDNGYTNPGLVQSKWIKQLRADPEERDLEEEPTNMGFEPLSGIRRRRRDVDDDSKETTTKDNKGSGESTATNDTNKSDNESTTTTSSTQTEKITSATTGDDISAVTTSKDDDRSDNSTLSPMLRGEKDLETAPDGLVLIVEKAGNSKLHQGDKVDGNLNLINESATAATNKPGTLMIQELFKDDDDNKTRNGTADEDNNKSMEETSSRSTSNVDTTTVQNDMATLNNGTKDSSEENNDDKNNTKEENSRNDDDDEKNNNSVEAMRALHEMENENEKSFEESSS